MKIKTLLSTIIAAAFLTSAQAEPVTLVAVHKGEELTSLTFEQDAWGFESTELMTKVLQQIPDKVFGRDFILEFRGFSAKAKTGKPMFPMIAFTYSSPHHKTLRVTGEMGGEDWDFDQPLWESYNQLLSSMAKLMTQEFDYNGMTYAGMSAGGSTEDSKTYYETEYTVGSEASTIVTLKRFIKN